MENTSFMKVDEVAQELGVSKSYAYKIVQRLNAELKEKGIWFVCADMDGEVMYRQNLTGPIGLVIGNEGNGLSERTASLADTYVRIPMEGKVESLNAAMASGILLYEAARQRRAAK